MAVVLASRGRIMPTDVQSQSATPQQQLAKSSKKAVMILCRFFHIYLVVL